VSASTAMGYIGQALVRLEETTSTIDEARRLAAEGAEHGTVIIASRQTAGRGRRGRAWSTLPGKSLAMTAILLDLPEERLLGLAGMSAALSVVHGVGDLLGLGLQCKWHNDVLHDGKKVAGTLADRHGNALLLSVGLNVNGTADDIPAELRGSATTLELACGEPADLDQATDAVIGGLNAQWRVLLEDPEATVAEWESLDMAVGREIVLLGASGAEIRGLGLGVDERGRLRLQMEGGELRYVGLGDVTLAHSS